MKYRKKILIKKDYIEYWCDIIKEIGERYEFDIEGIGSKGDQVHIFLGCPPKYSPSRIMNILKSITTRRMFKKFPEIKKQLCCSEL